MCRSDRGVGDISVIGPQPRSTTAVIWWLFVAMCSREALRARYRLWWLECAPRAPADRGDGRRSWWPAWKTFFYNLVFAQISQKLLFFHFLDKNLHWRKAKFYTFSSEISTEFKIVAINFYCRKCENFLGKTLTFFFIWLKIFGWHWKSFTKIFNWVGNFFLAHTRPATVILLQSARQQNFFIEGVSPIFIVT